MMEDAILGTMFFLTVVGGPIALVTISRVLKHRERMEMIRHGLVPPPNGRGMRDAAKGGWSQGPVPPAGWSAYGQYDPGQAQAQCQLRKGIQVACIGTALLIGLSFIRFHDGHYTYGPWLLGGLIPLFVGIAQIVTALLSGATLGVARDARAAQFGPVEPPHPTGSNVPPSSPYAGWRPGPMTEIEKPAGPPDRR